MPLTAGSKFGLLTVRYAVTPDIFQCDCKCGNELEVWRSLLICKVQRDCGMCRHFRRFPDGSNRFFYKVLSYHGHMRNYRTRDGRALKKISSELQSWQAMIQRCNDAGHPSYPNYGGRGIRVCERWRGVEGFGLFLKDMGPRSMGLSLDRINPQGHYEPTNCKWATRSEQNRNQRRFVFRDCTPPKVEGVRSLEARMEEFEAMEARLRAEAMELSGCYA
jgi:hypothetical protein